MTRTPVRLFVFFRLRRAFLFFAVMVTSLLVVGLGRLNRRRGGTIVQRTIQGAELRKQKPDGNYDCHHKDCRKLCAANHVIDLSNALR